ncbi:hypothetical protein GR160_07525 [Flavobacterium sp. Sd200]|uniref:hypothetical protein n=1 Tax=Flavobacterium sp. Sd200 TaxID=2692211 RepID=UPI00136A844B|nr:hypothetical protein [Flavobacterium sp. Sd200]MXN91077.1 hypothetical protein [Flavobacterium sp. Sd200]
MKNMQTVTANFSICFKIVILFCSTLCIAQNYSKSKILCYEISDPKYVGFNGGFYDQRFHRLPAFIDSEVDFKKSYDTLYTISDSIYWDRLEFRTLKTDTLKVYPTKRMKRKIGRYLSRSDNTLITAPESFNFLILEVNFEYKRADTLTSLIPNLYDVKPPLIKRTSQVYEITKIHKISVLNAGNRLIYIKD